MNLHTTCGTKSGRIPIVGHGLIFRHKKMYCQVCTNQNKASSRTFPGTNRIKKCILRDQSKSRKHTVSNMGRDEPSMDCLGLYKLLEADVDTVYSALRRQLAAYGLDVSFVVGFGSNGMKVMTRRQKGVAAKLKRILDMYLQYTT